MTEQITLEEALQLVSFTKEGGVNWRVGMVHGDIDGNVDGNVCGNVDGSVFGGVRGDVGGNVGGHVGGNIYGCVFGSVWGTISGKKWTSIETPREKLARLIKESGNAELIEAFNQVEI